MTKLTTIGERVKYIRKSLKKSLKNVGEDLETSDVTISRYENSVITMPKRMRELFCRKYGISRQWLDTGEGEIEDKTNIRPSDTIIQEMKRTLHLPDIVISIIESYERLPDYKKQAVERFIDDILSERTGGKKRLDNEEEEDEDSGPENLSRIA